MSHRVDTCIGNKCKFWKKYKDTCPNYIEGLWADPGGHTYATKDCAPKRSMILCQQIYDHMIDVRRDYNDVRNVNAAVLKQVINLTNTPLVEVEDDGTVVECETIEHKG